MSEKKPVSRRAILGGITGLSVVSLTGIGTAAFADDIDTTDTGILVAKPGIISCANWGARKPTSPSTIVKKKPTKIIVHHTVMPNTKNFTKAQAKSHARAVQRIHIDDNGWRDTGYNFLISRGGFITEGRHRSKSQLLGGKHFVEGAHTLGQNTVSLGISLEGSYHLSAGVPKAQWQKLVTLCAYACQQYGIKPKNIFGHRDFDSTQCPGAKVYNRLPALRKAVKGRL